MVAARSVPIASYRAHRNRRNTPGHPQAAKRSTIDERRFVPMQVPPKITWMLMAAAAVVVFASPATAQTVTVNRCAAAKVRCVMGYTHVCGVQGVMGLFKCYQTSNIKGRFVDQVCVQRTVDKITECWRDAERRNGPCLTLGDVVPIEAKIEAFVLDAVQDLTPGFPYPTINTCAAGKQKEI